MMRQLEQVHNRRKAFIYVSNGYDFDPFAKTRAKNELERYGMLRDNVDNSNGDASNSRLVRIPTIRRCEARATSSRLPIWWASWRSSTRAAEPRQHHHLHDRSARPGRRAGPRREDRHDGVARLRPEHAGQPAGPRGPDRRDRRRQPERLHKALKRIDQETSDYYVVGYYSTNPDPTKKRRTIEVKVTRPGANVWHRTSYTLEASRNEPR